ncbi:MAG: PAS domain-containing protein [Selenomonadaceae bacterium]
MKKDFVPPAVAALHGLGGDRNEAAARLIGEAGHPLSILSRENDAIDDVVSALTDALADGAPIAKAAELLVRLSAITTHYTKKGDLIYPLLATQYGITGPSGAMWSEDDDIRAELRRLNRVAKKFIDADKEENDSDAESKRADDESAWRDGVSRLIARIRGMMMREEKVLFPLCAASFSDEEWRAIYRDYAGSEPCLIGTYPEWSGASHDDADDERMAQDGDEVVLPSGRFTLHELRAMLNTLPMEITFIDVDDTNRYFNEGKKIFARPLMALGRDVYSCHPPKAEPMVRELIDDFKSGRRDTLSVWSERDGEPVLTRYMAVRDAHGDYVGTMECVERMGEAAEHFRK